MIVAKKSAWKLLGVLAVALALVPDDAVASTYTVRECTASQGRVDDATTVGTTTGYTAINTCGVAGDYLQVGTSGSVSAGQAKEWLFAAPAGTRINRAMGTFMVQGQSPSNGHRPYFFYRSTSQISDQLIDAPSGGSVGGNFDTDQFVGSVSRVGVGIACASSSPCANRSGIYSRIGDLTFNMADTVAPDTPVVSGPATNGWIGGTKNLDFTVSDTGSGVSFGVVVAGGNIVGLSAFCSATTDAGGAAITMSPCPSSGSGSTPIDTSSAAYSQGDNTVVVCAYEYGSNPQSGCSAQTIKVDTIAPGSPTGLSVAGGESWKRDNDFDLSWTNPTQAHAPIVGAEVRLTGPGAYNQTTYYPGAGLTSIENVQVPAKGDYTASVYLRDAAGNELPANASSVHLRFDNTVPVAKEPHRANGWINRDQLMAGFQQGWAQTTPQEAPPSGIAGYRVVVNANSDTDPCSGASDPRACGAPMTESGIDNRSRILRPGDLVEGTNYVHVVPISGSGMRATDVRRTPLKADFTDPVVHLQGGGATEWINHDASLVAVATDPLSGMQDTSDFPDDDPPATFLRVDGQTYSAAAAQVGHLLSDEGAHEVMFWARDLAGNTSAQQTKTVRIDKTPPVLAFTNSQDPDDPDRLVAPVSDALSGVSSGQISYRQDGGDQWKALATSVEQSNLVARVDSGDLAPDVTYEFRAEARDLAGNIAVSSSKENGDPMKVTGPFRTITSVVDLKVNGKPKARIRYGKRPIVTGELVGAEGAAVGGATVDLISNYYAGSAKSTDFVTVTSNSKGGFTAALPKGPGREIVAEYRGDRRFLGVRSAPVKASVRSKVTIKAPRVVDSDAGIRFTGKVKAKGATLGRRGTRLEVQVLVGKQWKTVSKSIRTDRKGKYRLTYKFTASYTRSVDYTFRAVALKERGFPYLPSKSKKRPVTVTP